MAKQKMETPYATLVAKKSNPSKPYYMLAELIDNSISSWEKRNIKKAKDDYKLVVDLYIDKIERTIVTVDNAEGMDKEQLENAIKLHEVSDEKNGLNMFGVGLKNSAFWFSPDLTIESKTRETKGYATSILTTKVKNLTSTVEWEAVRKDMKKRGTKVTFSNVYDDKMPTLKDLESSVEILSFKYNRYIATGNVKINLYYKLKKNQDFQKMTLKNKTVTSVIIDKSEHDKFMKHLDEQIKGVNFKYLETMRNSVSKLIKSGKPLEIDFDVRYNFENIDEVLTFTFGVLGQENKNNFTKLSGLTTYQHNRAINLPPKNTIKLGETIRTNIKRVYASVELGEIFQPDNNKTEFEFGIHKEKFMEMIKDMGTEISCLADAVFNAVSKNDDTAAYENSKSQASKLENALNYKTNANWKIKQNDSEVTIEFNDGKIVKAIITEVKVNDKNAKNYFIDVQSQNGKSDEYIIEYNVEHTIWKPLSISETINSIDSKTVIYPLVAIIGLSTMLNNINGIKQSIGKKGEHNILEIINGIANIFIDK